MHPGATPARIVDPLTLPPPGRPRAVAIAALYAAAAASWIYFSDRVLVWLAPDADALLRWSVYKGIGFVGVTTAVLFVVLARTFRRIERAHHALAEKERGRAAHELELERISRLYAALSQVNQAIVWSKTADELCRKTCDALREHGGFRAVTIERRPPTAENAPTETVLRDGQPLLFNDLGLGGSDEPWRRTVLQSGIRASAFFPIRLQGTVTGVLNVHTDTAGFFREAELALLTEAAADISFGLENLTLAEARSRAEAVARREQAFSSTMLDSLPGILYFYDSSGRFLRWNRNFEEVSGYSAEEVGRMHPRDFFPLEDQASVETRIAEVFTRGEAWVEAPLRRRDGTTVPHLFTGRRVEFEGRFCLVGVGIDISARRQAEEALEKSERRYRTTLDNILEGCQLIGFDWTYLYVNAAAVRHSRRPAEDLLGHTMLAAWPGIESSAVFQLLRRSMEQREPAHEETEFTFLDGSRGWFDVRVQPVPEGIFVLSIDLTERRQAESALREVQGRLQTVVENLQEGLVIAARDGDLLYWNPAALRLLGFETTVEGRRLQREFHRLFDLALPDGTPLPHDRWPLARAQRGEKFQRLVLRVRRRDRPWERVLAYSGLATASADGTQTLAFVTVRDITDQVAAESERAWLYETEKSARLEAENARRQVDHILESVTDAFVALDRDGRFVFVNDRAARILERRPADLLGRHFWSEFAEDLGATLRPACERAARELAQVQFEQYQPRHDAWFEYRIYPAASGLSIVFQDISERKRAEALLREANEQLELRVAERTDELKSALMRAEAADRIKSAFLATMSHELRTPLNSIIGFTGIVLQGLAGPLNEEQAKQLGMVRGSARHLLELINDVLDISKIEAGQLEVRREKFLLPATLEHVVATVRPLADRKGLKLVTAIAPELGAMESDRRRFEQILLNLINNAVKFTDTGEVRVEARLRPDFRLDPSTPPRPAAEISVLDTGIGIKAEDLGTLFQPFRQVDTGLARLHEGTGLGLAICRRLATLLDGTIAAQSEWGKGSVFTVTLPL